MAITVTEGRGTLTIKPDDTDDFVAGTDSIDDTYLISSIQFIPSAAADRCIIHDLGIDGVIKFDSGPTPGTSPIFKNFDPPQWFSPVMDDSDCTWDTAANCLIIIDYV